MALPDEGAPLPSAVRVALTVADAARGRVAELDLHLAPHPSETRRHTALAVLARALLDEPGLELRAELCRGREPALAVAGPGRRLALWVELGRADRARLRRATSRADRVVLVGPEGAADDLPAPSGRRVCDVLELPECVLRLAARALDRRCALRLERAGDELRLAAAGADAAGPLRAARAGV